MEATKEILPTAQMDVDAALLQQAEMFRELTSLELSLVGGGFVNANFA